MNKHRLYHLKYVSEKQSHRPNSARPGLRKRLGMKPIVRIILKLLMDVKHQDQMM